MILNTLENLGKFEAKGDEGYFIGYSMSSKAFRVFNKRTRRIEENLHVKFLENKAIEQGSGNLNSTASTFNPSAEQIETLIVESPIPTVSSPVPTACLNDSSETSSESRLVSKRVANQEETPSLDNILSLSSRFDDILGVPTSSDELTGVDADISNMETSISASPTPTHRIHKDHPKSQIIGPIDTPIETKHKSKMVEEQSFMATIHQKTDPALL
nr:ribonuclease H-like domain-containing protein [Tanacetum cinerariifolium]